MQKSQASQIDGGSKKSQVSHNEGGTKISHVTQVDDVTKKAQVTHMDDGTKEKIPDEAVEHQEPCKVNEMDDGSKDSKPIEYDYDAIKDITKKKEIWRLGVILDDMWIVSKGENDVTLEMLLRDLKGSTIQATVMTDNILKWKDELTQGHTYYMRNFKVGDNDA
ncbi:hypothetical protein L195_g034833, partial [Trifolium pratense]